MSQDQVTNTPVDPREEKRVIVEPVAVAEPVKETVTVTETVETVKE